MYMYIYQFKAIDALSISEGQRPDLLLENRMGIICIGNLSRLMKEEART